MHLAVTAAARTGPTMLLLELWLMSDMVSRSDIKLVCMTQADSGEQEQRASACL